MTNLNAVELVIVIARIGLIESCIVNNTIVINIHPIMRERTVLVDRNLNIA